MREGKPKPTFLMESPPESRGEGFGSARVRRDVTGRVEPQSHRNQQEILPEVGHMENPQGNKDYNLRFALALSF